MTNIFVDSLNKHCAMFTPHVFHAAQQRAKLIKPTIPPECYCGTCFYRIHLTVTGGSQKIIAGTAIGMSGIDNGGNLLTRVFITQPSRYRVSKRI